MKAKSVVLIFAFMCASTWISAQDLTGTWGGIYYSQTRRFPHTFFFFLEIKQKGKAVWGTFNTTDSNNNRISTCLCSFTGLLSRKPNGFVELNKGKVIEYNKKAISYNFCDYVEKIRFHYLEKNNTEYLSGTWFSALKTGVLKDGADGSIVVQYLSNEMLRDVDQYIPSLNKLKIKGERNSAKLQFLPDNISMATYDEANMIEILRKMMIR